MSARSRPASFDMLRVALSGASVPVVMLACLSLPPVAACGPDAPPNVPSPMKLADDRDAAAPQPFTPPAPTGSIRPSPSSSAPVPPDAGAMAPPPKGSFPPPKPQTIRLTRGDGAPVEAELRDGDAAIEAQDFVSAEMHYRRAESIAPRDLAPKVGRLRTKIAKAAPDFGFASAKDNHDVRAAVAELSKLVSLPAAVDYGPAYAELGRGQLLLGDAPAALVQLTRAAELLPDDPEVLSACGVAELASGNAENALRRLKRGVELDMGSAPRHGNLGTVLFMLGRVPEAIAEYEIEVALADSEPRAHSDLGTALLAANDVQRGILELRRAVTLDPRRATFRSNLGYALQLSSQRELAIAEYRKAIDLDPKLVSAWVNLATILARDPATRAQARAALMTAKRLDPQDPRVKANLDELDALEKGQILK